MAKRLIVCCDGTWNVAEPHFGSPTNVAKIALTVAPAAQDGTEQHVFYGQGVGTGRFDRLRGGMFGMGLSTHVLEAYRFLVDNFEPGDHLYLFGFSRGAFTARSLGGLIRNSGVLRREHVDRVDEAYGLYRDRDPDRAPQGLGAELFRRTYSHETGIRCLGVFDTVGALGVPLSSSRLGEMVNRPWQFHDTRLGPTVENAFHALAMDERRGPFVPTLWTGSFARGQRVEQAWFRGSHSDVGGGYVDPALAECALVWMTARARECVLEFAAGAFAPCTGSDRSVRDRGMCVVADPLGERHDSSARLVWRLASAFDRRFGTAGNGSESIADAAADRIRGMPDDLVPEGFRTAVSDRSGATP